MTVWIKMGTVKLLQYENAQDVVCALNYICDLNKCKHEIYGGRYIIALDTFNPYIFANQFKDNVKDVSDIAVDVDEFLTKNKKK